MSTNFNVIDWYKSELMTQIKPCPFCGGKDLYIKAPDKDNKETIGCCTCGANMQRVLGLIGLVQQWNERKI